ncbi:MAG: hypothetical protein EOO11_21645 [Chitinophagaceae bacterium]|nr:MAG: hypothetical protein EOO11_21645 [Chitinophagaceae bacterium]
MTTRYLLVLSFVALGFTAGAQSTVATPVAATESAKPTLSKEEKEKQKARQEQELADAAKAAGLTDAQQAAVRDALEAANTESKTLKANSTLTEEQKTEAKKAINGRKNDKLKEIMGSDNYKKWVEARKAQRAGAPAQ